MIKTMLKKKSQKQIERDVTWHIAKIERAKFLIAKYGRVICEYCGRPAWGNELGVIDAHHIDRNRRNNTEENCYLCHRICHSSIHEKRLKVKQLGFEWLREQGNY